MPSNHLIPCHPLLLLPLIFPSIRVFSNESVLHIRWPKYWSFSFSISPCNEYSGLISFRMDWLDLLAVQGTLKSLLQHHSSKASILWHSAFLIVQLSHAYMTTGKTIALTNLCWQSNVSAFKYAVEVGQSFSSKEQASFNFMAAVTICSDFWAPQNKVCHCFHCFPVYLPWSDWTRCHDLSFLNEQRSWKVINIVEQIYKNQKKDQMSKSISVVNFNVPATRNKDTHHEKYIKTKILISVTLS